MCVAVAVAWLSLRLRLRLCPCVFVCHITVCWPVRVGRGQGPAREDWGRRKEAGFAGNAACKGARGARLKLLSVRHTARRDFPSLCHTFPRDNTEHSLWRRDESTAFVDTLAARAAENAAAAVRAAAAEAENSAESEAMRQIGVLEVQLEQARAELVLEKLRNSESTDAVVRRLHAEQDQAIALIQAQAAEQQESAVERARIEAQALNKQALAAAQRAHEEELARQHASWEEEAEARLQAAVQKVQLQADAKIAEAMAAYRTGSSTSLKEETKRLKVCDWAPVCVWVGVWVGVWVRACVCACLQCACFCVCRLTSRSGWRRAEKQPWCSPKRIHGGSWTKCATSLRPSGRHWRHSTPR